MCENFSQVNVVQESISMIPTLSVTYAPYLYGEYPQDIHKMKEQLIKRLDEMKTVLISDYRSIRGLEVAHTIIFVDPEIEANAHFLIEAITRTVTNLDIISTKPLSQIPSTSIEKAFQKYADEKLMTFTYIDVTLSNDKEFSIGVQFDGQTINQLVKNVGINDEKNMADLNKDEEKWQIYFRYVIYCPVCY